ncbi:MAG: Gldg family protein [Clostridia bacterium]|nr:Gldg family protein [Clostridia bacterium]
MKKIKAWLNKIKNNRKLRCGGFSVALTVLAVVICILIAAAADHVESRFALTGDFSFNAATVQGDVTRTVLKGLQKDVHIYAVIPQEGENDTLMQMLERYDAASDRVTVSRESILRNPVLLERFSDAIGENTVSADCLIIYCQETDRSRVLDADDYYVYSYDTQSGTFSEAGLTYEKSVTEAILYVSQDELPVVQILTGQGELTQADTADMESLLVSANYQVKWVQLGTDEPDPESPLMILSPYFDFTDQELEKLMAYARQGGDFLIATQYSDPADMENFNALLRAYGVEILPGLVIADEADTDSYYTDTPVWLMPYMQETTATLPLMESAMDILLLPGARAFEIIEDNTDATNVYPVLETGKSYIRDFSDGLDTTDRQESDPYGYFNLAVWTDKMFEDGQISHALIIGNVDVLTDYWLQNNTHASSFFLQMLRTLQGKSPVNLDIVPKNALREGLKLTSITPAVIVVIMLPLLILCGALLVLLPRKSR